jgi:hypothetical protein
MDDQLGCMMHARAVGIKEGRRRVRRREGVSKAGRQAGRPGSHEDSEKTMVQHEKPP